MDKILPSLIVLLSDKSMITAANTIGALSEISMNKPDCAEEIIREAIKTLQILMDISLLTLNS